MTVSIIFPFRNMEKFIRPAFESLINQDEIDLEIIAINDGSTDDSDKILRSYNDERLQILYGPCQGLGPALNLGINASRGEFIARMDADDISMSHRIRLQKDFLLNNSHIAVIGSSALRIDHEGKSIGRYRVPLGPGIVRRYAAHASPIINPSFMARREVFEKIGGYWWNKREDYELWARILAAGMNIDNMAQPLLYYRVYEGSSSTLNQYRNLCLTNEIRGFVRRASSRDRFEARVSRCLNSDDCGSHLFRLALSARNKFNWAFKNAQSGVAKTLFSICTAILATAHPLVFIDSWHGLRSRLILRRNWKKMVTIPTKQLK